MKRILWAVLALVAGSGAGCDNGDPSGPSQSAWSVGIGGEYDPDPGFIPATDGIRFFASHTLGVDAFDAATGQRLWRATGLQGAEVATSLVARSGRVFVTGQRVAALDAVTGAVLWSFRPDSTAEKVYADADEATLYIGDYGRTVYALDAATGTVRWRTNVTGADWQRFGSSPIVGTRVGGDTLYVSTLRKHAVNGVYQSAVVVALDTATGRELWRWEDGGTADLRSIRGHAVVAGSVLVYADADGQAYVALRRSDGARLWRTPTTAGFIGPLRPPVVVDGGVYGAAGDGRVYALDLATGRTRWTARPQPGSYFHNALCGRAVLANQLGIAVLDKATGRQLYRLSDGSSEYAVSGFAVSGTRAFYLTQKHAVAVDCPT